MFYRVNVGTNNNELNISYDKYGNKWIGFKDLKKIQIRSNAKALVRLDDRDITVENDASIDVVETAGTINYGYTAYNLGRSEGIYKFVNNRKNYKPMLFTNYSSKKGEKSPLQHIIYFTISYRYKVLLYSTKYEINSTFGKIGTKTDEGFGGCTVVVDTANRNTENPQVFRVAFFDTVTKVYKILTVNIDNENDMSVELVDASGKEVAKLVSLNQKYNSSLKFRIRPRLNKLMTHVYICNADDTGMKSFEKDEYPVNVIEVDPSDDTRPASYNSAIEQFVYDYHKENGNLKYELACLTGNTDEENIDFLDKYLANLASEHITCVTVFEGVKIPNELAKKHNINNIIYYDMETGRSYNKR